MNDKWMTCLVLVALTVGCSDQDAKGDGWKFGDDVGTDVGGGDDASGGDDAGGGEDVGGGDDVGPGPRSVTFRLTNAHTAPVFAHWSVSGGCQSGAWVDVLEDGEARRLVSDCTRCACDAVDCAQCEIDCAPGVDSNAQLSVGEARTFDWDGLFHVDDARADGASCETARRPQSSTLTARFCWGHAFETSFDTWGEISAVECADVEFSTTDRVVEYTIPATTMAPVSLRLTNASAEMRYAHISTGSPCSFGSWVTLYRGDAALRIEDGCGNCSCVDANDASMCPEPCPAIACAPPTPDLLELPPGGVRAVDWARTAFFDSEMNGIECEWDRLVAGPLTARFCWGTGVGEALELIGEQCETVAFDPFADSLVAHEIVE